MEGENCSNCSKVLEEIKKLGKVIFEQGIALKGLTSECYEMKELQKTQSEKLQVIADFMQDISKKDKQQADGIKESISSSKKRSECFSSPTAVNSNTQNNGSGKKRAKPTDTVEPISGISSSSQMEGIPMDIADLTTEDANLTDDEECLWHVHFPSENILDFPFFGSRGHNGKTFKNHPYSKQFRRLLIPFSAIARVSPRFNETAENVSVFDLQNCLSRENQFCTGVYLKKTASTIAKVIWKSEQKSLLPTWEYDDEDRAKATQASKYAAGFSNDHVLLHILMSSNFSDDPQGQKDRERQVTLVLTAMTKQYKTLGSLSSVEGEVIQWLYHDLSKPSTFGNLDRVWQTGFWVRVFFGGTEMKQILAQINPRDFNPDEEFLPESVKEYWEKVFKSNADSEVNPLLDLEAETFCAVVLRIFCENLMKKKKGVPECDSVCDFFLAQVRDDKDKIRECDHNLEYMEGLTMTVLYHITFMMSKIYYFLGFIELRSPPGALLVVMEAMQYGVISASCREGETTGLMESAFIDKEIYINYILKYWLGERSPGCATPPLEESHAKGKPKKHFRNISMIENDEMIKELSPQFTPASNFEIFRPILRQDKMEESKTVEEVLNTEYLKNGLTSGKKKKKKT